MKRLSYLLLILIVSSCANKSLVRVNHELLSKNEIKSIYIPIFEGNPDFIEESTDFFIADLKNNLNKNIKIIQGTNILGRDKILKTAKNHNADAFIIGKVTSHKTSGTLNGFSTIKLISIEDGNILANFHRPSGMLIAHSEHQAVLKAVERTANDLAGALNQN